MFSDVLSRLANGGQGEYPARDLALVSAIQIAASEAVRSADHAPDVAQLAHGWLNPVSDVTSEPVHAA
jgi:hypothetical protein